MAIRLLPKRQSAPRLYSYGRYSSPEQSQGHSEERQGDIAQRLSEANGLPLDQSLFDRGLSAFRGRHRTKGALGRFLADVEAGNVPPGSALLIEHPDRLTREGLFTALQEIIFKLFARGISIWTPEAKYKPGCENDINFLAFMLFLQEAYRNSKTKSERVLEAKDKARIAARNGTGVIDARCPHWLKLKRDKSGFEKIPERVRAIQKLFALRLAGHGIHSIEKLLNGDATIWSPPTRWRASYVKRVLKNRAVLGEHQSYKRTDKGRVPAGEPIPDYFPRIIEPADFALVQKTFRDGAGTGGRRGDEHNLFRHFAKCAYCGSNLHFKHHGRGAKYLRCGNKARGIGCCGVPVRYADVESAILDNCPKIKPEQVLPSNDEQAQHCADLQLTIDRSTAERAESTGQIENFIDQIGRTKSADLRARYEARVAKLQDRCAELTEAIETATRELETAQKSRKAFEGWARDMVTLRALIGVDAEARARLHAHLRMFIDRIEIFSIGKTAVAIPNGAPIQRRARANQKGRFRPDDIEEIHQNLAEDGFAPEVCETALDVRLGRSGWFIRVWFKSGSRIDLVPNGSVADGFRLGDEGWQRIWPSVPELRSAKSVRTRSCSDQFANLPAGGEQSSFGAERRPVK